MNRRDFLKFGAASTAVAAMPEVGGAAPKPDGQWDSEAPPSARRGWQDVGATAGGVYLAVAV